jgi:hypothetical protein
LFVLGAEVGEQEADGYGLDAGGGELGQETLDVMRVERF